MKKIKLFVMSVVCLTLVSCGGIGSLGSTASNAGSVLGNIFSGGTVGNILSSVIGLDKPSLSQLIGTWSYVRPGVAFTSENLLAKAGGEVTATEVKNKLATYYNQVGISSSNTKIVLNQDMTFSATIAGRTFSGSYTYDQDNSKLTLKSTFLSIPCYVKRGSSGTSFLFESKKLLTLLQTVATISGNSNLQAIGSLSKNYDGIRLGFEMK